MHRKSSFPHLSLSHNKCTAVATATYRRVSLTIRIGVLSASRVLPRKLAAGVPILISLHHHRKILHASEAAM